MFLQTEQRPRNHLMSQSAIMSGMVVSTRPLQNINLILQPQANKGALYLGDVVSTLKDNLLEMNKIKAILTCMGQNHHLNRNNFIHKVIHIKDTLDYPIHLHFDQAVQWIQEKRKEGNNVLVHCHAGVSRSASIVTAYLMRCNGWTAIQALNYVRSKRERAKPNANFWNQLIQYEQTLSSQKEEQNNTESKLLDVSKLTQTNDPQSHTRKYRRRKIFETPPIEQNHDLRNKNIFSIECLPPTHNQRHSQSIAFNSHNKRNNDFSLYTRSEIYQNKSAIQQRGNNSFLISQSRINTPPPIQWQQINSSPSVNHIHNNQQNYTYKQTVFVSPFELDHTQ